MNYQVGTQFDRLLQARRCQRRIDQQWQALRVRQLRDARDVEHFEPRIAERFAKQERSVGPDCVAPGVEITRIDEARFNTEARQGVGKQVMRSAVQRARGDDVPAGAHEGDDCQVQCRLATRRCNGAYAALERGDALFEYRIGRI